MDKHLQRGISLVEIMIGLAILGISMAWAMPSYRVWMQNTQIRNMAESIVQGLQQARSEAIKRNAYVEFVLTNQDPTVANEDMPTLGTIGGNNWVSRAIVNNLIDPTDYAFVTGSPSAAGSSNATVQARDSALAVNLTTITFSGLGRVAGSPPFSAGNDDGTAFINKICVRSSTLTVAGGARIMEIDIAGAGQIRMCDPTVVDATDTRRCIAAAPRCS